MTSSHHFSSEEALDAFLDGELPLASEQELFNALQSSAELRTILRDTLSIRRAVHRDSMMPPSGGEAALLSALGLPAGMAPTAATVQGSGLIGSRLTPMLTAVGGLVAGYFLATTIINNAPPTRDSTPLAAAEAAASPAPPVAIAPDTVYAVRYVAVVAGAAQAEAPAEAPAEAQAEAPVEAPAVVSSMQEQQPPSLQLQHWMKTDAPALAEVPSIDHPALLSNHSPAVPVTFRARSLASGLPSTEPTPASVRDAILPNTSFGLLFPINQHHAVGVEMGTESFRQQFTGTANDRQVQYTQTPVLFWMGASYRWTPMEFSFLPGLMPVLDATVGFAVQQGPLARASMGLQYQPVGPLQITLGLDAAALLYRHEGTWFSSTKWGPTIGFGFNLGALR